MKLSSILSMPINVAKKHVMLTDGKVVLIPATDESTLTRLTAINMVAAAQEQVDRLQQVLRDWAFLQNEDFDNVLDDLEIKQCELIEDIGDVVHAGVDL